MCHHGCRKLQTKLTFWLWLKVLGVFQRWNLKVQQAKTSVAVAALVAYNVIGLLHQAKNERLNNSNNDFKIIEAGGNTKQ